MAFSIQKSPLFWVQATCLSTFVIDEGPSKEISAHTDGTENMNSGSNVYKKLDKTSCTYFEESVPEPFSVQFSIAVSATTTQSYYRSVRNICSVRHYHSVRHNHSVTYYFFVRHYDSQKLPLSQMFSLS